jgi:predicted anti-sigma-YlaC factor YlaD
MNCHTVQNFISAFIDCELDSEIKREIRRHLFSCPDCNAVYQGLQNIKKCLENLDEPALTIDPVHQLFERLEVEKHMLIQRPIFMIWGPRLLVTAVCVGIFFLSALTFFPLSPKNVSLANQDQINDNLGSHDSFDRNFSFDQSVTVYQASAILP